VKQAGVGEASAAGRCQECTWAGANTCSVGGCTYGGEYCAPSGICADDGDCSGATPHCVPPLPGGNPYCGRCAIDAHCPAGQGCRNGECHVFPPGDRCGEPMELGTLGARTDFAVSLAAYGWETNDGSWDGHDAFYRFTLTEESTLTIDGRSALSWASGRFRLFGEACAGRVGEHYFGNQVYNPPYSTYYPAWTVHLPAGTWVLAVGGYADPEYAVSIQRTPVTLAEGLGCATPTPIVQSASGSSVTGTTDALLSTSGDSCASERWYTPARTAVYSLDLAQPSYVALAATPLDAALLLDLDVKDDCRAEAPRDVGTCNADAGVAVTRTFAPMPAGLHYVVVDAEKNTNGSYRLDAVVTPWSMNDLCADAKPLTFDAGGVATETGTIAVNTSTPSAPSAFCGGLGGNDVFYAFTTTADQRLDVQVQGDGTWKPGVSVRPACGATSGPVCAPAPDTASAAVASVDILPAGTWLVQVASPTGAAGGPFTLQVGLSAPVYPFQGNDTCATATALTAGTTVSGDTRGVTDDLAGVCGATVTGAGKDLAYVFTAPSRGSFEFRVMPGATFQPVLRTTDACPGTAQLACGVASAPGTNTWLPPVFLQANESVYAWVDGYQGSAGAFTLNPIFLEAPANDLCAGATVIGSTWNAINLNVPGSVATAFTDGTCAGAEGPDVFFKMLVPNGRWNVTVTVDPTSYFQPAVAYYGSCGTACAASAVAPAPGANAVLGSVSLNGSGYFGVSSVDGGRGSFNLIVTFL
jgi:hypothetical protein